jgi:hypothetical protein
MGHLPTNQGINEELILLNQLIERPATGLYPTQYSKVGYVAFFLHYTEPSARTNL